MCEKLTGEAALIFEAGDFLRARGTAVTPKKVESYVREHAAQEGTLYPGASPAEITTVVDALMEQATNTQPEEHEMKTQEKQQQRFAVPTPYYQKADNQ